MPQDDTIQDHYQPHTSMTLGINQLDVDNNLRTRQHKSCKRIQESMAGRRQNNCRHIEIPTSYMQLKYKIKKTDFSDESRKRISVMNQVTLTANEQPGTQTKTMERTYQDQMTTKEPIRQSEWLHQKDKTHEKNTHF